MKCTMFEFNRSDRGEPTVTAYLDNEPLHTRYLRSASHLFEFINSFDTASATVRVAKTETEFIPQKPDLNTNLKPLKGHKILLDAGHSESRPGAHGKTSDVQEYAHNAMQAKILETELQRLGATTTIFDPDPDNLTSVGDKASGHTIALFLHHNAFDADGVDEGTECHIHPLAKDRCLMVADRICSFISRQLNTTNRGVLRKSYTVLSRSILTDCTCNILVESYFIDDYSSKTVTEARSRKAALAICDALVDFVSTTTWIV